VPGGTFNRNGDPALPATVSTFRLDDYEVTVGRFRKFVEAGHGSRYDGMEPIVLVGGANPNVPGSGWWRSWDGLLPDDIKAALVSAKPFYTWTLDSLGGHEDFPIAGVNWAAAHFFCIWDGGRLPTDLEWQYAATGGNLQRTYPWGASSPDSSHASFNCTAPCTIADLGTYASKPAGSARWGQFNMAGNMSEWTFDGYDPAKPPTVPCVNCATLPEELKLRIVRGGNASSAAAGIETKAAAFVDAKSPPSFIGFRCAR
jgi:formylglycine-generating enzyme required for sulfatase activity